MSTAERGFASDNCSGAHPEVLAAIAAANVGHVASYGDDPYTAALQQLIRGQFGSTATAYPVFNGTGANVVALQAMCSRWGAAICAASAHAAYDECGAPEKVGGLKLLTVVAPDGKLTPELVDREAYGFDDVHRARPEVVAVTQSTELGTVYSAGELAALCEHAHALGLSVYLDGARLANAATHLGVPLAAITTDVGVDVLSFGGTKNGLLFGELIVVLDPSAAPGIEYVRKYSTQLGAKMRFVAAQFSALLDGDLWQRSARNANAMADLLHRRLRGLPEVSITQAVQANAVFAVLPARVLPTLRERFAFQVWDEQRGEVRLMTSFDTTEADVHEFAALLGELARAPADQPEVSPSEKEQA
ncbi:MAG: threonine aldolase family protein [Jatrophihabitantaceae bacterium]